MNGISGLKVRRRRYRMVCSFAMVVVIPLCARAAPVSRRAYSVEDSFKTQSIGRYFGGPYAFGPHGQSLAFTKIRPYETLLNYKLDDLWDANGDIWVQMSPSATPINITHGAQDGSGWWAPSWSPDGQRLMMLSTRGGNVHLWLWDAHTRGLRQLSARGVNIQDARRRQFTWVDEQHVLVRLLPQGKQPMLMRVELQTPKIASREWRKAREGKEATASVLDSGVPIDVAQRSHSQLCLLDVGKGKCRVLADANVAIWRVSPKRSAIAFTPKVSMDLPKADESLPFTWQKGKFTLHVAASNGLVKKLTGQISEDVLPYSIRWSPDGTKLAFLGYAGIDRSKPPQLYRVNLARSTVTHRSLGGLNAAPIVRMQGQIEWAANGRIIVFAAKPGSKRRDWWLITDNGRPQCLTAAMEDVPKQLRPSSDGHTFDGLAGGELWRIDSATRTVKNITADFTPNVVRMLWPIYTNDGLEEWPKDGHTYTQIFVVTSNKHGKISPYRINLINGRTAALSVPALGADLTAYDPHSESAIFYRSDNDGLFVWRVNLKSGKTKALVKANTFLRNIAEGTFKPIDYTSLDGKPLKGWLILPPNYRAGRRYPLLTWVYAGLVYGPETPWDFASTSLAGRFSSINMQIPAAHGYVVLMPSMPLKPEGSAGNPMLHLTSGVLPAVNKVISMGIADPKRIFLMGHSFGGFSTYGLITQTNRFTAAVAMAGLSDMFSLYGQFDARKRYTEHPQEDLFMAALMESAQVRMGGPPWKDPARYSRNSPILFADQVNTPLMIIQGDLDPVAVQQGEEFFTALYRQGKRARFVRYWGEGHMLRSPANIRDMWHRVFTWFDEFSPKHGDAGR